MQTGLVMFEAESPKVSYIELAVGPAHEKEGGTAGDGAHLQHGHHIGESVIV